MAQTTIDGNEKLWFKKIVYMPPKILILLPFPPNRWFLQTDDFAPISSKQMRKSLNILKKSVVFFYMAGREVEIHRGRLDKKILADRAQLFPRFLSKKIFKNFKKFRKIFSFFWMEIWKILENLRKISTFFVFDPSKMTLDFPSKMKKKVEIFKNF